MSMGSKTGMAGAKESLRTTHSGKPTEPDNLILRDFYGQCGGSQLARIDLSDPAFGWD
jgi:hypothetical protein